KSEQESVKEFLAKEDFLK
nr:cAMP-dependent protein kinase subunit CA [swine, heart, Peptide Partial, 18 aa] [Sus scrofa]AAB24437.1 cAMP-dependent protein kinase subunit CB [swine, heart, Peptide Partial, 18 aa] [Sus scrofa]